MMSQISFQILSSVCAVIDSFSDDFTNKNGRMKSSAYGYSLYAVLARFKQLVDVNGLESDGNLILGHF